jgi:hypothetical protein
MRCEPTNKNPQRLILQRMSPYCAWESNAGAVVRDVARARTLTVLRSLDGNRKRLLHPREDWEVGAAAPFLQGSR